MLQVGKHVQGLFTQLRIKSIKCKNNIAICDDNSFQTFKLMPTSLGNAMELCDFKRTQCDIFCILFALRILGARSIYQQIE